MGKSIVRLLILLLLHTGTCPSLLFSSQTSPAPEASCTTEDGAIPPGGSTITATYILVDSVNLDGNRLTRRRTIMRELPFTPGDSVPAARLSARVEEGRSNLMNTGLFNFVDTEIVYRSPYAAVINYSFVERWNIWPLPVFELDGPNLNQWLEDPSLSKLNYGFRLLLSNLGGYNERLRLIAKTGNVQSLDFAAQTPYFGKEGTFRAGLRYSLDRTGSRAYATRNNEQVFVSVPDRYISREYMFGLNFDYRPGLYSIHRVKLAYNYNNYADTLLALNPRFGPGGLSRFSYISLGYSFLHDKRDIAAYPLDGYMIEAGIERKGLNLLGDTDMDVTTLCGSIRYYRPLGSGWYTAYSINTQWSEGTTLSYFDQQGLGYNSSIIRGYENYVVDGYKYLIVKGNIKYNLLPEKRREISFIPSKKFSLIHYAIYTNFFIDLGIMTDRHFTQENTLANKLLAGSGFGIDLHTYYDMVLRTELTVNRHGSTGLFFHLLAPI